MNWIDTLRSHLRLAIRPNRKARRALHPRLSLTCLEGRVVPATRIWDGGGADNLWTTAANWSTDVAPVDNDDLTFPTSGVRYSPVNDFTNATFGTIVFGDYGYTVTGNPLNLTGGITTTYSGVVSSSLDTDITLLSNVTISVSGGGFGLGGAVSDGAGTFGLTKTGAGSLGLGGANTYDGTTTISGGAISISNDQALGSTSGNTVVNGGSLYVLGGSSRTVAEDISLTGGGSGSAILVGINGDSTLTGAITIANHPGINALNGTTLTLAGNIDDSSGTSALTLSSDSTSKIVVGGTNLYDGVTNISGGLVNITAAGGLGDVATSTTTTVATGASLEISGGITLPSTKAIRLNGTALSGLSKLISSSGDNVIAGGVRLGNSQTFEVAADSLTISGVISQDDPYDLTKSGLGLLALTGTNTYTGLTTIDAGTLLLSGTLASGVDLAGGTLAGSGTISGAGIVTSGTPTIAPGPVGGTGILTYSGSSGATLAAGTTFTVDLNGSTVGTGYDQLKLTNGSALFNPNGADLDVQLGYLPAVNTSFQIVSQTNSNAVAGRFNGVPQFGTYTSGPVTFSVGYFSSGIILTVTSVIIPTFTWDGGDADDSLWSSPDNWVGDVAPTAGGRLVFASGAARANSTNDFAAATAFDSIEIQAAAYNFSGNAIQLANGVSTTYASGTATFGLDADLTATQTVDVATGGTLVLAGAISGSSFGVTKTGGGTLQYGGTVANTYTGATTVVEGTLELNRPESVISIQGDLVVGDNIGTGATVRIMATDQIANTQYVTVYEGAALSLDGGVADQFMTLTMQGSTVDLAAGAVLNPFFGLTTLATTNNVTANIQGAGSFMLQGTFIVDVADDPSVPVDLRISATLTNPESGTGALAKDGLGTLVLSGANTYTGRTYAQAGVLLVESNGAFGAGGDLLIFDGASMVFDAPSLSFSNNFLFAAGAGHSGTGAIWVASGETTFTGTMSLGDDIQLGAAAGSTLTINGVIDDTGSSYGLDVVNDADGRTVLSASNQFDGAVTVHSGFLRATNSDALGAPASSSGVTVSTGASLELSGGITIPSTKPLTISGTPVTNFSKIMSVAGDNTVQGDIAITGGNNVAFDVAGGTTLTVSGAISGSLDFDKNNTGTLVLTGTNTNTGNVNVGAGTLIVDGSLATSNSVFVDGTLGGTGTLPAVTISSIGTLAPGNSPGIISTGALAFTTGSTFSAELNGATAGTQYDQTNVTGTVTLAGATLSLSIGYSPAVGTPFALINNDGSDAVSGTFAGLAEGATITSGSATYAISYVGGDGNDVVLTLVSRTGTWTGLGGDGNWSTAANWAGGVAPVAGDDLVFPAGAARTSSVNDFAAGTNFKSITIDGAGFSFTGNAIQLDNGVTTTYASGTSTIALDTNLTGNQTFDVATGGTLALSGVISGSVAVSKTGAGTLQLGGADTYSGPTTVASGTLLVDGSIATSAVVTLVAGATLGGSGTLPAFLLIGGGTVAPGNPSGALASGSATFAVGSTYAVELNGTTAGTQYDQLNVTGAVFLTGATLATTLGFTPAGGDTFVLISNDSSDAVIGTFTGLSEGGTFLLGGTTFRVSYIGGDGNDVTLTAVPLPELSITSETVAEGNSGTTALTFTVTLSAPSLQTVTVAYTTADGTATAGTDYTAVSGTLTFAPGVTTQTVTVLVNGDTAAEADETFRLVLSSPVAAVIAGSGTGTITNDDTATRIVLGPVGGMVQQLDPVTGQPGGSVPAYTGFAGEVRVSSGDVDGDGVADLVTGAGAGSMGGHVKVFDGATGAARFSFLAFDGFAGGVFVATGDVNGDGLDDIVVSADAGAAPHVKVFSGKDGSLLQSFLAYDVGFLGGVRVAVGDVDGDGFADIVTGNGAGAAANVKVFSGKDGSLLKSFLAYDSGFTGGVYVAAGDVDGDGFADIVTGSGPGTPGGHVKVFSGRDYALEESFFAFDQGFLGGVRVGTALVDGETAVLVGSGPGTKGHFKAFGADDELLSMFAGGSDLGGVYVA